MQLFFEFLFFSVILYSTYGTNQAIPFIRSLTWKVHSTRWLMIQFQRSISPYQKKFSHGSPAKLARYWRDIGRNAINRMGGISKRDREKKRKVGDRAENDCQTSRRRRRYSNGSLDTGTTMGTPPVRFRRAQKVEIGKYIYKLVINWRFMEWFAINQSNVHIFFN